ncbi:MAG: hypothetical protein DI498_02805 [Paracoccus denitrificans]|nr:MAG: hypothetical protein DI498_02805 [Paracoccus denitrificans]PZO85470.1 MAG: hypothetical protein DI633_02805 [Paracoccus denitrificans]
MGSNILHLENFAGIDRTASLSRFSLHDVDRAYRRGFDDCSLQTRAQDAAAVCAALTEFSADLDRARSDKTRARAEAVEAIAPMIDALVTGAVPAVARGRMQAAVLSELRRLSESATNVSGRLRCDMATAPFLERCLQETGVPDLVIDATAPDGVVEALIDGGKVVFDEAAVARDLERLITEILEDR